MVPLLITLPSDVQRRLRAPLACVVIQLPSRASLSIIPDDGDRHDLRLVTFGKALVQFEIHRIFSRVMLKATRKPGIDL